MAFKASGERMSMKKRCDAASERLPRTPAGRRRQRTANANVVLKTTSLRAVGRE
jgi:hypothetical protein